MQLTLKISLFGGALGEVSLPEIGPDTAYQAGLILEGFEEPVGVEFFEVTEDGEQCQRVLARTLDPDMASISQGAAFFITRSGKMLGKGTVESTS